MSITPYYLPPETLFLPIGLCTALALLSIVEAVALIRVPRLAAQRSWRQWLALVPVLTAISTLAFAALYLTIYLDLKQDPLYTPSAFRCGPPPYPCTPTNDANITQAFQLYSVANAVILWVLLATYVVALAGFLDLAIGRRKRAAPPVSAAASTHASPSTDTPSASQ